MKQVSRGTMNQHHSVLSEIFGEKYFWEEGKFVSLKKKLKKIGQNLELFFQLWSHIYTKIKFFRAKSLSYHLKLFLGLLLV